MDAIKMLESSAAAMKDRAAKRDTPGGERSMAKTVAMYNLISGKELSEADGWLFMVMLKIVRGSQGEYHEDDYVDAAAYCALQGEAAGKEALRKKTVRETLTLSKPSSTIPGSTSDSLDALIKQNATRVNIPIFNATNLQTDASIPTLTISPTTTSTATDAAVNTGDTNDNPGLQTGV